MFGFFGRSKRREMVTRCAPIGDMGRQIVTCAISCQEETKHLICLNDQKKLAEREFILFCEHLYFYFFLGHWSARSVVSSRNLAEMLDLLKETIPKVAIASRFEQLPERLSQALHEEFLEKLEHAEERYEKVIDCEQEEQFADLLQYHAEMVVRLCEREEEWPALGPRIVDLIFDAVRNAKFDQLAMRISEMQEGDTSYGSLSRY